MNKIDKKKTTFISGLWIIDNNPKNSYDHYIKYLPNSLDMLRGSRLLFFYDDENIFDKVNWHCRQRNITIEGAYRPIEKLPTVQYGTKLVESCKMMCLDRFKEPQNKGNEKGSKHYWRDFKRGSPDLYRRLITIWTSKIALVWESMQYNNFCLTEYFGWVDMSVARFCYDRRNWNFMNQKLPPGLVAHYGSPMTYYGVKLPINASFLFGNKDAWHSLITLYNKNIDKIVGMPYAHDEETILYYCAWEKPSLFYTIGEPKKDNRIVRKIRKKFSIKITRCPMAPL